MKYFSKKQNLLIVAILSGWFLISCSTSNQTLETTNLETAKEQISFFNLDTVKAQRFDTGKMWTFEDAPVDYFSKTYNFKPSQEWLDDVRLSALKFANWCSSSFVSEDGLVMTNHHCIESISKSIEKEGENIKENGFYAQTLANERKIPGLFVDQLAFIQDITEEVQASIDEGKTDKEKNKKKSAKISELIKKYNEATGLKCKVTSLYHGGKYSLYGYKRYTDVRAVFFAEFKIGLYGGDPDNFTFPRYNSDFAFVRVYDENGKPLKTKHYFKFSMKGPQFNEPIFVVGNPGSTDRLRSVAELKYMRDVTHPFISKVTNGTQKIYEELMEKYPSKRDAYESMTFFVSNSAKVYRNLLKGLRNPYLMARKEAFEREFKNAVMANPKLKAEYGHIWEGISSVLKEKAKYRPKINLYGTAVNPRSATVYFNVASKILNIAEKLQMPEETRPEEYKGEKLEKAIENLFPTEFSELEENKKLQLFAELFELSLTKDDPLYKQMFSTYSGKEAVEYILKNSKIATKEAAQALAKQGADAILNSNDPFMNFLLEVKENRIEYLNKYQEADQTLRVLNDELGEALFAVYGTSIPPDATFTLRISDGVLKGYDYNGTIAPAKTTFYGLYDRYYSHDKKRTWDLPEKWKNPPAEFDMSTPYNFIATCDIVGGNSGSPVINKNKEIIGIAFDGNIESLTGSFIFTTEANRMVSVASQGMVEILENIYKATRISDELKAGKIIE